MKSAEGKTLILHLSPTTRCNLRCDYCYAARGHADMSWATAKLAVDRFADKARAEGRTGLLVTFEGGEPLVRYDFMRRVMAYALRAGAAHGLRVGGHFCANATLLTPARLKALGALRLWPAISLGGIGADHDAHRRYPDGRGTFADIDRNVRAMGRLASRLRGDYREKIIEFRLTFTPDTLPRLAAAVKYIYDNYALAALAKVVLIPAVYRRGGGWNKKAYAAELRRQFDGMAAYMLGNPRRDVRLGTYECLSDTPCLGRGAAPGEFLDGSHVCGCGRDAFAVSPEGKIFPCYVQAADAAGHEEYALGDVRDRETEPAPRTAAARAFLRLRNPGLSCRYWAAAKPAQAAWLYGLLARNFARAAGQQGRRKLR